MRSFGMFFPCCYRSRACKTWKLSGAKITCFPVLFKSLLKITDLPLSTIWEAYTWKQWKQNILCYNHASITDIIVKMFLKYTNFTESPNPRMSVGDLCMSSSLTPLLKQAHLDSSPWATALVQDLFLWRPLRGLWSLSGHIHLLHYGLLHTCGDLLCMVPNRLQDKFYSVPAVPPAILLLRPWCLGCCLSPQFLIPLSQLLLCTSYCGVFWLFVLFICFHRGITGIVHWLSFGQGCVPFETSWNRLFLTCGSFWALLILPLYYNNHNR